MNYIEHSKMELNGNGSASLSPESVQASSSITDSPNSDRFFEDKKKKKIKLSYICEHMEDWKESENGIEVYRKIHTNFVSNLNVHDPERPELLIEHVTPRCDNASCRQIGGHMHACLQCIYFGCLEKSHIEDHFKESGHCLVCSLNTGSIYCYLCCDFMFDRQLDIIATRNQEISSMQNQLPFPRELFPNYLRNKSHQLSKRLKKVATSNTSEASSPNSLSSDLPMGEYAFMNSPIPKATTITEHAIYGLRGLINLGQTCFLNAIVQALVHTPMLRDFFLTEHVACTVNHGSDKEKPCIAPLFSTLFQDFYNGSRIPMSLHDLLYKMWVNAEHMSGYDQQDAHEFFMAMIHALQDHFIAEKGANNIISMLFEGKLESTLTCTSCSRKSVKLDPIYDASIDLVTDCLHLTSAPEQKSDHLTPISLDECFQRFCQEEFLQESICSGCNQSQKKQLKFLDVPVVFMIHLKRFKHRGQSEKVNNPVKFPEHLDMTPYTPVAPPPELDADGTPKNATKKPEYRYVLYGVVNHQGSYEGGHYYAYIRNAREDWYACDDSNIYTVDLKTVLESPGYLLFYHRESVLFHSPDSLAEAGLDIQHESLECVTQQG